MLKRIALLLLLVAPMSLFAQKFAHFKSMDIIPVMPEYAKAQTDIQALQKQYEDEIKRASDEFSKKFAEYQQEQKTLPQNIQERRQKELQEMQEKGIQFQQEAQQQPANDADGGTECGNQSSLKKENTGYEPVVGAQVAQGNHVFAFIQNQHRQ